jgi:uncharacterized protein (UPF0332 family)
MIDERRIEEAKRNVKRYIADGLLKVNDKEIKNFIDFYLKNSETSLQTASLLFQISTDEKLKEELKISKDFECYLWVIVSSYYSMFYMALALLATEGIRVGKEIVHKVTADALINFFIVNEKLAKLLEDYEEIRKDVMELLGKEELKRKARELISDYEYERRKRSKFQYEIGVSAKQSYARTSLERAKKFFFEIRKLIKKL